MCIPGAERVADGGGRACSIKLFKAQLEGRVNASRRLTTSIDGANLQLLYRRRRLGSEDRRRLNIQVVADVIYPPVVAERHNKILKY